MSKLEHWDPEDHSFWERTGNKVASRNLLISIPNLLLGFSVWIYWGMVAKYIQELHFSSENGELFNFTFMNDGEHYDSLGYRALLFTLPAVAGFVSGRSLDFPLFVGNGGTLVPDLGGVSIFLPPFVAASKSMLTADLL